MKLYIIIIIISTIGIVVPKSLYFIAMAALLKILYNLWQKSSLQPKSKEFKELERIKLKREKKELQKHRFIEDQIAYIGKIWGYNKTQELIVEKFITQRAYGKIYTKLTASLLPQLILLIEECNMRGQKGCKAEVNSRLRSLIAVMKEELKKSQVDKKESFETTLEVFDYLVKE